MNNYYFTFGFNHAYPNGFVKIQAEDPTKARIEMIKRFGKKWAFQYDEETWNKDGESQQQKFNLNEVSDTDGRITIGLEEYKQLKSDARFLSYLEAYGVDNWDGYSDAHKEAYPEDGDE